MAESQRRSVSLPRFADAIAWVKHAWRRVAALFVRRRGTPMLHVLQLPMTREILGKMTVEERSAFLLLGYASNQVNALWKLVIIATNETPENPIEQRVTGAQTQIFVRLTIGAMHEAWLLVERSFLKNKIGREWASSLDADAQAALERLKKRFGKSNPLSDVRNNFAFHHPKLEQMEAAYQLAAKAASEDIDWSVFFQQGLLNTSFFVSDFVLVHGIVDILGESDVNQANEKLLNPLHAIALDISEVTFGFAKLLFQKYINEHELVMNVVAHIKDAPDIDKLRLPFYVQTPGLRDVNKPCRD
jgi:hypothetical protein